MGNVGFPIAVSVFLLVRLEARLGELQQVIWRLAEAVAGGQEQEVAAGLYGRPPQK